MLFKVPTPDSEIDLEIRRGDILVFLGANGTGKTRLGHYIENCLFKENPKITKERKDLLSRLKRKYSLNKNELDREVSALAKIYNLENSEPDISLNESGFLLTESAENGLILQQKQRINELQVEQIQLEEYINLLTNGIENSSVLEFSYCERVSAHRSLVLPGNFAPKDIEEAKNELHFGKSDQTHNTLQKWGKSPFGALQTDFDKLMTAFFSEEADSGARFRQNPSNSRPTTNIEIALKLWNKILTHRRLEIDGLKIRVYTSNKSSYEISELSEGERSLFYIIGKCLFAKNNSLIIIDEPDIHIHKAIIASFFDAIEKERSDCAFIYITHDLSFAESRAGARKFVLHAYEHSNIWDVQELSSANIPEQVYSLVCGSRQNILFVEGKDSEGQDLQQFRQSLDAIYRHIYTDFRVILVGSCESVKQYTLSLNEHNHFHRVECFGLIDRDDLSKTEIDSNKNNAIHVSPVAIIENAFLIPEVAQHIFEIVGEVQRYDKDRFSEIVIEWIEKDENWKARSIKRLLKRYYESEIDKMPRKTSAMYENINAVHKSLNPISIVTSFNQEYEKRLVRSKTENNPIYLLEVCRGKNVLKDFAHHLGLKDRSALESKILGNIGKNENFSDSLKAHFPKISL